MEPELAILKPAELFLKSEPVMRNMMKVHRFTYQDIYRFNEETSRKAIWSGRVTNDFKKWLDNNRYQTKITSFFN